MIVVTYQFLNDAAKIERRIIWSDTGPDGQPRPWNPNSARRCVRSLRRRAQTRHDPLYQRVRFMRMEERP